MKDDKKSSRPILTFVLLPLLISAIWEKKLSPLFDPALEDILSISNRLIVSISNTIYTETSKGVTDRFSSVVCSLLFGVFCAFTLSTLTTGYKLYKSHQSSFHGTHPKSTKKVEDESDINEDIENADIQEHKLPQVKKIKFLFAISIFIAIVVHLFCFAFLLQQTYVCETSLKLTNNIEIVSPYISDYEYKQLKSEFYSMQSRSDYDDLVSKLKTIGSENRLQLK